MSAENCERAFWSTRSLFRQYFLIYLFRWNSNWIWWLFQWISLEFSKFIKFCRWNYVKNQISLRIAKNLRLKSLQHCVKSHSTLSNDTVSNTCLQQNYNNSFFHHLNFMAVLRTAVNNFFILILEIARYKETWFSEWF